MKQTFGAKSDPDVSAVWDWFEFQLQLITSERRRFRLVFQGKISSDYLDTDLRVRFLGLDESEVNESFENQRIELELLIMLALLATTEAILRIDYDRRVTNKLKDNLSKRYRDIQRERQEKVRLDEDILEALKEELNPPSVVSEFRKALKLRHWLAHGRHWHPKLGRGYLPTDIFDISREIVEALPS